MANKIEGRLGRYQRKSLADQVYLDLKKLLLSGAIAPGEKVTLRGLAESIGTSPMPVRDAVRRLVSERALEMLPNRTLCVPTPSLAQFREIVAIRCSLEGLATEAAAVKLPSAALAEIYGAKDRYEAIARAEVVSTEDMVEANRELHFTLYSESGMPVLVSIIEGLWVQVAPVFSLSMSTKVREVENMESFHHHLRLVAALECRDAAAARDAVVADIQDAAHFIEHAGVLRG
ncbi:GntR family transcriptional regulator [Vreelandella nanhaiensis]|uniref:GntR family transcriptional regulator n=1 Tax=Vreelandella nanhaiensis TaxID=1258546 RepID=A0A3S0W9P6_9GAMM|nr:GntR family transcriptional regulator [Halomonas nanhaiensis]RUR32671.1 GntR family transcriptional regulator [Halomonas nanhaiensis]